MRINEILNEGVPQLVKQGVAESGSYTTTKIKSLLDKFIKPKKMKMEIEKNGEELYVDVILDGKEIARFTFDHIGNDLRAQDMFVIPEHRGKGISKWVYDSLKSKGYTVNRSTSQTDDGAHFWDKNKGPGSKVWEQDVAEGDVVKFKQKPSDSEKYARAFSKQHDDKHRYGVGQIECPYCGDVNCDYDCDESQADGFNDEN